MRLLLALLLLALPILPGSAGAETSALESRDATSSMGAARGLADEYARGARAIGTTADSARAASESAPRSPAHSAPVPRFVLGGSGRLIARGSELELGAREAARGEHSPYFPTAPPHRR